MKKKLTIIVFLMVLSIGMYAQPSGKYTGNINVLGRQIGIELKFEKVKPNDQLHGTISIPSQGAFNLVLKSADYDEGDISMRVDTGMTNFRFDGKYYPKGDSLSGKFYQSGYEGTFEAFAKVVEDKNWVDREVTFYNDTIQLAGTLSLPDTTDTYPGIIFISGSGTQDRDENVMGFKIFKTLAKYFIENGYAVLRYDDRGAGDSDFGQVDKATTADFSEDARSAFHFLRSQKNIQTDQIGFLGHSEGSIIANRIAARNDDVAFTIMIGGPALSGYSLLIEQTRAITKAQGKSKQQINSTINANKKVYREVMKEQTNWDRVKEFVKEGLEVTGASSSDAAVNQQLKMLKSPWFQYYLNYDPARDLKNVNCPVLAVYGENDTQVPPKPNIQKLNKIKQKNNEAAISIETIDYANHLFQKSETGSPTEYQTAPKEFVNGFPKTIINWIDKIIKE
jgi:pimeloyl-ACP methyl ester carboxylesterase